MNEYYVERLAHKDNEHIVHNSSCPSLPAMNKLHFIGVRASMVASVKEAAHFWNSNSVPCPVCMAAE